MVVSGTNGKSSSSSRSRWVNDRSAQNPDKALCDGPQSLRPERYEELLKQISKIAEVVGKKM